MTGPTQISGQGSGQGAGSGSEAAAGAGATQGSAAAAGTVPEIDYAAVDIFMCGNAEPDTAVEVDNHVRLAVGVVVDRLSAGL